MHRVEVRAQRVTLPDGNTYEQGDIAVLEEADYERIRKSMFSVGWLVDLGSVHDTPTPAAEVVFPGYFLEPLAFYASGPGGRVAFACGTSYVPVSGKAGTPVKLAALLNPVGSGKDIWINVGEFSSSFDTRMRRYSVGAGAIKPVTGKEAQKPRNIGGGSAVSVAKLYRAEAYDAEGGDETKAAYMKAFATYEAKLKGASILRPGRGLYWTVESSNAQGADAMVYFEWWELPSASGVTSPNGPSSE